PADLTRRSVLAGALLAVPTVSLAQADGVVTIVVPYTAGTGIDICARLIGDELQKRRGQSTIVENKPGASGNIGTAYAASRPADGRTLLMIANTFVTNIALFKAVPYDPQASFTPIALVATGALALAIHPQVPAHTAAEFVAYAKSNAGAINYGSPGRGTPQHLAMELLKQAAGINLVHVPYTGSAGVVRDLVGGHVSAMFIPLHTALPLAKDGQIRILAIGSAERTALAPDIPTLMASGLKDFDVDLWYGLLAPANLPGEIADRLNGEINQMLADPRVAEALSKQGLTPQGGPAARLASLIAKDQSRWVGMVKAAGIAAE
ncbi:MAG: tripartite tricarboxylate transporter substrate binding protein, partial [Hyphomicrobiales bacterium]